MGVGRRGYPGASTTQSPTGGPVGAGRHLDHARRPWPSSGTNPCLLWRPSPVHSGAKFVANLPPVSAQIRGNGGRFSEDYDVPRRYPELMASIGRFRSHYRRRWPRYRRLGRLLEHCGHDRAPSVCDFSIFVVSGFVLADSQQGKLPSRRVSQPAMTRALLDRHKRTADTEALRVLVMMRFRKHGHATDVVPLTFGAGLDVGHAGLHSADAPARLRRAAILSSLGTELDCLPDRRADRWETPATRS